MAKKDLQHVWWIQHPKRTVPWEDKSGHTLFLKDSNKTSENSKLNGHIIMLQKWNFLSQQPRMSFEIFNILKLIDHKVYNVCFYWCFWSFVQKLFFMKNSEFTIFHKNTVLDSFLFLNHHKSMFCILFVKLPCGIFENALYMRE